MSSANAKRLKRLSYEVINKLHNLEIGRKIQPHATSSPNKSKLPREYNERCGQNLCINALLADLKTLLYSSLSNHQAPGLQNTSERFFASMDRLIKEVQKCTQTQSKLAQGLVAAALKNHKRLFKIVEDNELNIVIRHDEWARVVNLEVIIWGDRIHITR